ncbi:hypothetical protein EUX98_g7120 [Antrodiella citrinella]|uniref:FAD/NAD(P)-binding domain-containing protein n=1 Tax=Antrodiella citrinella TaxID=2447956 RepID=A0A4S4MP35_9APHY|nr:hypothetical protein EUX98_g7120 [Antrodiella citrinella]
MLYFTRGSVLDTLVDATVPASYKTVPLTVFLALGLSTMIHLAGRARHEDAALESFFEKRWTFYSWNVPYRFHYNVNVKTDDIPPDLRSLPPCRHNALPTLDRLNATVSDDLDVQNVSQDWLTAFSKAIEANDVDAAVAEIHPDDRWRVLFALTWDLRTFQGSAKISQFLQDRSASEKFSGFQFIEANLEKPYPDIRWIRLGFSFETKVALGQTNALLVPTANGSWKAFVVCTNLENLKEHPEKMGELRSFAPNHGKWQEQREREQAFVDGDPEVLIIGAGQSGLDLSARLKNLGVSNLIVEKQARVGDQWRNRYQALCLHDPIWFNQLPYLAFPETWPTFIPARKLADWLEFYANTMELNVWNSSAITHAVRDDATNKWVVTVKKEDGSERVLRVDHLVFALGLGAGSINIPDIPGKEDFRGQVLHSTSHHRATDHLGKKVVIVGACTSAHDIAADYAENDVDVTMFQRSSTYIMTTKEGSPRLMKPLYWQGCPPTEYADRIANATPIYFNKLIAQRQTAEIAEADKTILDGLKKVGYNITMGDDGSGFLFLALKRAGGYYLDVGACQMIIDGKIKIKGNTQIERFTKTGLKFTDGSELQADVVLYATGFGDVRDPIRKICGDEVGDKLPPIWGLNDEGELRGTWRELGTPGLWYMMGNLAWSRFFSKHVALQIKAKQVGVFGERYSAPPVKA